MPTRDSSRRPKHRKKTDDKLDLDELTHAPNLGGMLSFLSVPPEEARRRQLRREAIDAERAIVAVGPRTTVADNPSLRSGPGIDDRPPVVGGGHFPSLPNELSPPIDSTAGGEDRPPVVGLPTVGHTTTVRFKPILIRTDEEDESAHRLPVGFTPTEVYSGTVVDSPTARCVTQVVDIRHNIDSPIVGHVHTVDDKHTVGRTTTEGSIPTVVSTNHGAGESVRLDGSADLRHNRLGPSVPGDEQDVDASRELGSREVGIQSVQVYSESPTVVDKPTVVVPGFAYHPPTVVEPTIVRDPLRKARVFRATLVQHGHTPAEQLLYLALWSNAKESRTGSREVTAGYRQLAHLANLNDKTVKYALQSLIQKLAIELIAEEHVASRTGRTYRVFSYEQILAKRNRAGLIWVRKNKGVEFVEPPTVVHRPTVARVPDVLGRTRTTDSEGASTTEGASPPVSGVQSTPDTGGSFTTPLGSSSGKKRNETSTSTFVSEIPTQLMLGLRQFVPLVDEQAVWMLWTECRARVNDCTVEEILAFVQAKASIALNGKIQNPVGFLLTAVPRCFEGAAFTAFREDERRRRADEENRKAREEKRLKELQEQGREEAEAYEKGKTGIEALSQDEYQALYEKSRNALLARYPNALRSAPKTIENLIEQEMIRGLQS
jgi:hypothetical protein